MSARHYLRCRPALFALLASGLAACQPATPPAETVRTDAPASPTSAADPTAPVDLEAHWQCGEQAIVGRFDNQARTLSLIHEHGQLVLPQAMSGSGARYADGNGNELWIKGEQATLTRSGLAPQTCTVSSEDPPPHA